MPFRLLLLALCLLWITPSIASAQLADGGLDLRLFRPALDSRGLLGVDGTDVLPAGQADFGLVLDAGFGIVPFDGFVSDETVRAEDRERTTRLVDQLFTGTLLAGFGLGNVAAVGIHAPIQIVGSSGTEVPGQVGGASDRQGLSSLMLFGKLRLLRVDRDAVGLAAMLEVEVPTGDASRFSGSPGFALAPSIALEWRPVRAVRFLANVGYRFASQDTSLRVGGEATPAAASATDPVFSTRGQREDLTLGDRLEGSIGASVRLGDPIELAAELHAVSFAASLNDPRAHSAEAGLGLRFFVDGRSHLSFGGTIGVTDGVLSPDARAILGFVFEPAMGDRDGDGISDDLDACPNEPEDFDDFEDTDGCPDPDDDRDGILDVDDSCRLVPEDRDGDADDDGCPEGGEGDRDGDTILDHVDACPDDPEDRDGYQDEDGCPEDDDDGDRILDRDDLCPRIAEDPDGFEDEDGCPDPDNDDDRVLDVNDACPDDPEEYNALEDEDGCPDVNGVRFGDGGFELLEEVRFATDSAQILPESDHVIAAITAALQGHPQVRLVEIQGHADERGDDAYNIALTRDRAAAVLEALVMRGVDRRRMRSAGYGERCPKDPRHEESAWRQNRRVEIKILETDDGPTNVQIACPAGASLVPR